MSNWLFKKIAPYAIKFKEWSKDKFWIQIPLYILIFWMYTEELFLESHDAIKDYRNES